MDIRSFWRMLLYANYAEAGQPDIVRPIGPERTFLTIMRSSDISVFGKFSVSGAMQALQEAGSCL
jgi:hypothetical protein